MTNDENKPYNFDRIEKAIKFIIKNFNQQPKLEEIAEHVNMSQYHFQRVFKEWAGVSPKKFLEYLTIQHAKKKLLEDQYSNTKLSQITGLSSPSRVHDLFINVEGMSPGKYKSKGKGLKIYALNYNTIFGQILIGATSKGICHAGFLEKDEVQLDELKNKFPNAEIELKEHEHHRPLLNFLNQKDDNGEIKLHLSGTPFQLKVWQALMTIPEGNLVSYSQVAQKINKENATRAVASAIAKNPIAVLIPCHRVIQSTGIFGEYHWGKARKTALIGFEASKTNEDEK